MVPAKILLTLIIGAGGVVSEMAARFQRSRAMGRRVRGQQRRNSKRYVG
jgi:hypothetical protein